MNYTEAYEKAEELLKNLELLHLYVYERAALSHREEAIEAWKASKAAIYDVLDLIGYLEILKRE